MTGGCRRRTLRDVADACGALQVMGLALKLANIKLWIRAFVLKNRLSECAK